MPIADHGHPICAQSVGPGGAPCFTSTVMFPLRELLDARARTIHVPAEWGLYRPSVTFPPGSFVYQIGMKATGWTHASYPSAVNWTVSPAVMFQVDTGQGPSGPETHSLIVSSSPWYSYVTETELI